MFHKAQKAKCKLRLLDGPSGSGKTYSALILASELGKKVAVIDTEKGSAALYSDKFQFDTCELMPPYTPESYVEAIKAAENMGYDVIIIDSLTHEWSGDGGCLDIQAGLGGRYTDWAKVTPRHNKFIEAILQSNCHIIATARSKSEYTLGDGSSNKYKVTKVGTKTEQRDGLDFEFTTVFRLNQNHMFTTSKDRTFLFDGKEAIITKKHATMLLEWLDDGVDIKAEFEKKIKECSKLDDLKDVWKTMPAHLHSELNEMKDEVKEQLINMEE